MGNFNPDGLMTKLMHASVILYKIKSFYVQLQYSAHVSLTPRYLIMAIHHVTMVGTVSSQIFPLINGLEVIIVDFVDVLAFVVVVFS